MFASWKMGWTDGEVDFLIQSHTDIFNNVGYFLWNLNFFFFECMHYNLVVAFNDDFVETCLNCLTNSIS